MGTPLPRKTMFMSGPENEACAREFAAALKEQGITSTVEAGPGEGPWSVLYSAESLENLLPLMVAIETSKMQAKRRSTDSDETPSDVSHTDDETQPTEVASIEAKPFTSEGSSPGTAQPIHRRRR